MGKIVIISSLNGTSERTFDNIQELIPHAEEIIKLNTICTECGSEYGAYSYFMAENKKDKVKAHEYTALCRNCYKDKANG